MNIIGHHKPLITNKIEAFPSAPSKHWRGALSLLVVLSLAGCHRGPACCFPRCFS